MDWYAPLTILPAIGLLIMSTGNFIISLNNEITALAKEGQVEKRIIRLKLAQLRRLGAANACFYTCALFFLVAGLIQRFVDSETVFLSIMMGGLLFMTAALVFLVIHSFKSIRIRHEHLGMGERD